MIREVLDTNKWGNSTANDVIQDSKKSLNVLVQQPEVDPKRITIIGHREAPIIYVAKCSVLNN
jgi:dienelactone hydrolase